MFAVGSPHTWPTLLAALTWLREMIEVDCSKKTLLNDMGLATNYGEGGGATKRKGVACEVFPLRKGGKSFSHAERGAQKVLEECFRGSLKF